MKFGLMFFASAADDARRDKYRLVVESARFADTHGFSSIWVPERHFTAMGCLFPNPAVLHAALAMCTERTGLRAGSVVAPLHDPLRIAEDWAVVDNLSGGRVGVSFASGWNPTDFAFFPERYAERHQQTFEAIEIVRRLWTGGTREVTTGRAEAAEVRVYPTPVQPELPIWLTAANSPSTFQMAGALGANLLTHMMDASEQVLAERIAVYREARAAHGHDPAGGEVTVMLHTFVGPDADAVDRAAREPYCDYLENNRGLVRGLASSRSRDVDLDALDPAERRAFYRFLYARFAAERGLIGTPETCRPLVERLAAIGVTEIACLLDFGVDEQTILEHLPSLDALRRGGAATPRPAPAPARLDRDAVLGRCVARPPAVLYERLRRAGVEVGPPLMSVQRLWVGEGEALADVRVLDESGPARASAVIDGCIQVVVSAVAAGVFADGVAPVPAGVGRVRRHGPLPTAVTSHVRCAASGAGRAVGRVAVYDGAGRLALTIDDIRLEQPGDARPAWRDWLWTLEWDGEPVFGRPPAPDSLTDGALARRVEAEVDSAADLAELARQRAALDALDEAALGYVGDALAAFDAFDDIGAEVTLHAVATALSVRVERHPLLRRALHMLTEAGALAAIDRDRWRVVAPLPRTGAPPDDDSAAAALLGRCGPHLLDVLRGEREAVELLFPDGDTEVLAALYRDTPAARVMNATVRAAVGELFDALPADRGMRILEIGAGVGGTTSALLDHLPPDRVEYLFTDIGPLFVSRARARFADRPWVAAHPLDIERSPEAQGLVPHAFDVVIAANVLHATADLGATLRHVRTLLAPGGWLVLLEAIAPARWVDLTFGLTDGWWRFADDRVDHPLLDEAGWRARLSAAGFEPVASAPPSPRRAQTGQAVLVARASAGDPRADVAVVGLDPDGELSADLRAALPDRVRGAEPVDRRGLVFLGLLDRPPVEGALAAGDAALRGLLRDALDGGGGRTVWVVTRGSQAVEPGESVAGAAQAAGWALGQAVMVEHPELDVRCVDLDPAFERGEAARALLAEIAAAPRFGVADAGRPPSQVALRGGRRHRPRLRPAAGIAAQDGDRFCCRPEATYLITGGLGGLGLRLSRWLVDRGARHLTLVGRTRPSAAAEAEIERLRAAGATVVVAAVDVTDRAAMARLFQAADRAVRGVFHLASVFGISPFAEQSAAEAAAAQAPEVRGAWVLHTLTREAPLDAFVLFGSLASVLPYTGLSAYAAGNASMGALAHHRRALGLPALTVDWGAWGGVGHMADARAQRRMHIGEQAMAPEAALAALGALLTTERARVAVAPLDPAAFVDRAAAPLGALFGGGLNAPAAAGDAEAPDVTAASSGGSAAERRARLDGWLRAELAAVMRADDPAALPADRALIRMGLDSLMAVELRARIKATFDVTVPLVAFFDDLTLTALVERVEAPLAAAEGPADEQDDEQDDEHEEFEL